MARPKQNLYGQDMGSKGFLTREKIVAAAADLMQRRPLREIRVAEIGKGAGVSTSTFYLYFESVSDAGLAAVEQIEQATPEVIQLLEEKWTPENFISKTRELVDLYIAVWDKHHALLRVRNFVADEGDRRFAEVRRRAIKPLHLRLQLKIGEFQAGLPDELRLDPPSTTSVIIAMLERTAQIIRLPSAHKAKRPKQVETAAFLVACAISGGVPFPHEPAGTVNMARDPLTDSVAD